MGKGCVLGRVPDDCEMKEGDEPATKRNHNRRIARRSALVQARSQVRADGASS